MAKRRMRRRWLGLVAALAMTLIAAGASAGPFTGNLSVIFGGLPPVGVDGAGTGGSTAAGVTVPASVFSATTSVTVPGPLVTAVRLTAANDSGAFTGATLHGPMAIRGSARLMNGGLTAFTIPLTIGGTRGVGLGGAPLQVGSGATAITVSAGTWSAGLVQVTGIGTPNNLQTVSFTGSDQRTAMGAGALTLVTPMRISNPVLGSFAGFGVLRLVFAPEPSSLALLVTAALLGLTGVRRARRG
ncbi:MAG TPA: PEP-CTERM sorting domain-containing protein [Myxococcota bacterium]|nr:PEP-CTERM sorting domain-containing protein [Myxococcota bacterium]